MPVGDYILDNGLTIIDTQATHIYICHTLPTTFTEASSTYACGNKNFGAGAAAGAPAAGSPNGRQVTTTAITDGSVTATNASVGFWAITDNTNSRLHAAFSMAAAQATTSGNTFQLPAFIVRLPGA